MISLNKIAKIISLVFIPHTFTLFIYIFYPLKYFPANSGIQLLYISLGFIFGFFLHILAYLILYYKNSLRAFDLTTKEQRNTPYIIQVSIYMIGLLFIALFMHLNVLSFYWIVSIINGIILFVVNKKIKISSHMLGASGALGFFLFIEDPVVYIFILLIPLIFWARKQLKSHTNIELLAGCLIGLISTYFQLKILIITFVNN